MRKIARRTEESKGRLLVVDDDVVQRTVIGKIGAKIGYDTVTASRFETAAEQLRQEAFDVMTLDLSLGERDGVELLRLIADCGLHAMPIVVISGHDERILNSTRRVAEGLNLSLVRSLTKPLNLEFLREALSLPGQRRNNPAAGAAPPDITRAGILAGIARKEFFVEFQPKIGLERGEVVGAEALARWQLPEFGFVSPAAFIPMAEGFGVMAQLTDYLLAEAVAGGRKLVEQHPGFTIAVNISGSQLTDLILPERIESALRAEHLSPESLIVEVTESVAMEDVDRAVDILVRLRIKGIGAAIDDFGTGYSSLSALARLPFSELKIDQSFVRECGSDADMMKIVDASVGLARAFKMKVVAEGIEDARTLARLRAAGCDVGQGYLFSPALRSERLEGWIQRYHSLVSLPMPNHLAGPYDGTEIAARSVSRKMN